MLLIMLFALLNAEAAMPTRTEAAVPIQSAIHWDRADWRVCHLPDCQKPTPKTVVLKPVAMPPDKHISPEIPLSTKE
jgi:hypothetical protein